MITASIVILILSLALNVVAKVGIDSLKPPFRMDGHNSQKGLSIIVPFRNEVKRIDALLNSLSHLQGMSEVEVLFVDDHSEDETAKLIRKHLDERIDYKILQAKATDGSPKKAAIIQAVAVSKFYWIATLDADGEISAKWLTTVREHIKNNPDILVGPISVKAKGDLLGTLQKVEAVGIQQLARGMHGMGRPIIANGANLIYKKVWFERARPFKNNSHIASGDDMFLLKRAVEMRSKIHYMNSSNGLVSVYGEENWNAFFTQRIRWLKKSKSVGLLASNLVGGFISLVNLWTLVLFFGAVLGWTDWGLLLCYMLFKSFFDSELIYFKPINKIPWPLYKVMVVNIVYPWLMLIIFIRSLSGGYSWKGRAYKK